MKRVVLLLVFVLIAATSSAQLYTWGVGARIGGDMSGVAVKYMMSPQNALEGFFSFPYKDGVQLTGLYQRSIPITRDICSFYYGGGAHIGSWASRFNFGVDVVVGVEGKIADNFALSFDYKPALNIVGYSGFHWSSVGLGLKYAF